MMFNCYNHGWSHIERECPKCFPSHITTTTSTTHILPDAIIGMNKSELDRLKAENARYREALEYYANGDTMMVSYHEDRYSYYMANEMDISNVNGVWKNGMRARKALEDK